MNPKKLQIINAAIKLFAQKGYHLTSMQEIADSAGMAKGSMYFYFKSKEDLLLSIYKYYYDLMFRRIQDVPVPAGAKPKEKLAAQLHQQLKEVQKYRTFIEMQMKERLIPISDDMKDFIFSARAQIFTWYREKILEIYGKDAEEYSLDGATMLDAIMSHYMGYLILDNKPLDLDRLARFIVDRLEDLIEGMRKKRVQPVLDRELMADFLEKGRTRMRAEPVERLEGELARLRGLADRISADSGMAEDIASSLQVMEEELHKTRPNRVILRGMTSFLQGLAVPEFRKNLKAVEELLREMEDCT